MRLDHLKICLRLILHVDFLTGFLRKIMDLQYIAQILSQKDKDYRLTDLDAWLARTPQRFMMKLYGSKGGKVRGMSAILNARLQIIRIITTSGVLRKPAYLGTRTGA